MLLIATAALILLVVLSNVIFWPRVRPVAAATTQRVSVLIPARNEENNIGGCLEAVLAQGLPVAEVLVYNDHSSDNTGAIIQSFAAHDERVRLIDPEPLPADWCGKNFACAQLASHAQSPWLLFLDADTRLRPHAVSAMLAAASDRRLTMLSCWPGFSLINLSERAFMPMLNFVVFTIFPALLSLYRNEPSLGLAHGACLLVSRESYERLDGHAAVRGEIFEDTRLAQLWREHGERSLCLDGQDVVRVRMYANFREIWCGFQKNFFPAFRREWVFWSFLAFQFAVFLLPFILWNRIAVVLILLSRLLLAVRFGQPLWSALLHPVAELVMLLLGISSWWHCRSGRGVAWKGRVYRASRV